MSGWNAPPRGTVPARGELHVVRAALTASSTAGGPRRAGGTEPGPTGAPPSRTVGAGAPPDGLRTLRRVLRHMLGPHAVGAAPERLLAGRSRPVGADVWCGAVRSGDTLLAVLSRHADVGVDLQPDDVAYDESLHLALTRWEQGILRRLSLSSRHAFFLALWARKEAVLRAAGHGLRICPSEVGVLVEEGVGTVPVPLPENSGIVEVHLRDVPLGGGAVAAVASTTPVTDLYTWDFDSR